MLRMNTRAFLLISFVVSLLACGVVFAADLGTLTICRGVTGPELFPADPADKFTPDTAAIHAVVKIYNGQPDTKVKGVWISVDAIPTPDYEILSSELVLGGGGTRNAHFELSKPTKGWPKGNYQVDVYIDGKKAGSAPFSFR